MIKTAHYFSLLGVLSTLFIFSSCQTDSSKDTSQSNQNVSSTPQDVNMSRLSEAFGHFIGKNLNNPGPKFDLDAMITGMRNGYNGKPAPMSDQEYEEQMAAFQEKAFQAIAEKNLEQANAFLEKNKDKPNVQELDSGKVQYLILDEGEGEGVTEEQTPSLRYKGQFLDGTVFGSSDDAGGKVLLSLKQTIPGFRQGVLGMKKGEKRKIFVHPDEGYGISGQLPPNQLLIFEVEMLDPDAKPEYKLPLQPTSSFQNDQNKAIAQAQMDPDPEDIEREQENDQLDNVEGDGSNTANYDQDDEEEDQDDDYDQNEEDEDFIYLDDQSSWNQ